MKLKQGADPANKINVKDSRGMRFCGLGGFRRDRTPRLRERRGPRRRLQRMERRGASDDRTRVLRNLTALRKVDRFDERQD